MPISVECPACEQVFKVSSKYRNRKGRCPHCDGVFVADESVIVNSTESLAAMTNPKMDGVPAAANPSLPIPGILRNQGESSPVHPPSPPPTPTRRLAENLVDDETSFTSDALKQNTILRSTNANGVKTSELTSEDTKGENDSSPSKTVNSDSTPHLKSSTLVFIAIGLMIVSGAIALGVAELLRPASNNDVVENKETDAKKTPEFNPVAVSDAKIQSRSSESLLDDDEKPTFFSMDQLFGTWSGVYSYMVKLDIQSNTGDRTASGIIIDSRGWIVTSYRAIRGASNIRVSLASTSMTDGDSTEELSDRARGVIAVDPQHDLAIIAVNRRLVRSVADLKLDERNMIVGSQRLSMCRAPRPDRRLWITDVRVSGRATATELDDQSKILVDRFGYGVDAKSFEQWILLDKNYSDSIAGAALFDSNDQLAGIVCQWSPDSPITVATHVGAIARLLQSCDPNDLKPLNLAFAFDPNSKTTSKAGGMPEPAPTMAQAANLDPESTDFKSFQTLYKLIEDCQEFDWIASDESQAKLVCDFSRRLLETNDLIEKISNDEQKDKSIDRLQFAIAGIGKHIDSIEAKISNERIQASNELILARIGDDKIPFAFLAGVHRPSMLGPKIDGKSTVMFKIEGTEKLLLTVADKNHFEFRPGSLWMIIGAVNENSQISVNTPTGKTESAIRGDVVFAFEIVD